MRRPCAALLLLPLVFPKLLRINEWYALTLPPFSTASLQLNLFYSCDSVTMMVKTGKNSTTRMHFFFDGDVLEKMDVDSTRMLTFPQTHRVLGGCREVDRKLLIVNVTSTYDFFEIRVDDQFFKRPKARRRSDQLEISIPQESPCCVIRAVMKSDSDESSIEVVPSSSTTLSQKSTSSVSTTPWPITTPEVRQRTTPYRTRLPKTVPPTTSSHEYKLYSWTDVVNREWSVTFIVTAVVTCIVMGALVLFGLISFFWLLTIPRGASTVYRVDTPGLY